MLVSILLAACRRSPETRLASLAEEFAYRSLAFSPPNATSAGLHEYDGQKLDELLDDYSLRQSIGSAVIIRTYSRRLERGAPRDRLSAESRADYEIVHNQILLALLDLNETQSYLHNPTIYVESLGNAVFSPLILEYAPKAQRIGHIIARLQKVPLFIDQAKSNLVSSPAIWTSVAAEENEGNIGLVDTTIRADVPNEQRAAYDRAGAPALDAMRDFQRFLRGSLAKRDNADWRWAVKSTPESFNIRWPLPRIRVRCCNRPNPNCSECARACWK